MVPLASLWLPILLSAVIVFLVSFIIHMVLPYHRTDYRKLPSEDAVLEALRKFDIPPGDYMFPRPASMKEMNTPEFLAKRKQGPVGVVTFMAPGPFNMGGNLAQWFAYSVVVSVFAAYVTGRALGPSADYLAVFRIAGCTAFVAYSLGLWQDSIWYKRAWSTTLKNSFDGLVYGLMTGGTLGWLWPR